MSDNDENIRARAHQIWEQEGRPDGREAEHWRQAAGELADEPPADAAGGAAGQLHVTTANDPTRSDGGEDQSVSVKTGSGHTATTRIERETEKPAQTGLGSGNSGGAATRTTEVRETTVTRSAGRS